MDQCDLLLNSANVFSDIFSRTKFSQRSASSEVSYMKKIFRVKNLTFFMLDLFCRQISLRAFPHRKMRDAGTVRIAEISCTDSSTQESRQRFPGG